MEPPRSPDAPICETRYRTWELALVGCIAFGSIFWREDKLPSPGLLAFPVLVFGGIAIAFMNKLILTADHLHLKYLVGKSRDRVVPLTEIESIDRKTVPLSHGSRDFYIRLKSGIEIRCSTALMRGFDDFETTLKEVLQKQRAPLST